MINTKQKVFGNLINGEWEVSTSHIEIFSPIDGCTLGKISAMTQEDADNSIKNTKLNLKLWAEMPLFKRAEILYKAADIIEDRCEDISHTLMLEVAKEKKSAIAEVLRTADFIRFTADAGKSLEGQAISAENFPGGTKNKISYVTRVPLGTVLAISPFNYPVNLSASKIAPALMGGNAVVLKPPTQGSISALKLADAFNDAGLPKGILNTVTGRGSEIGDYIVTHPDINFINFTGSTQVGKHISQLSVMVPVLMELGGKDAAIVCEDADLDFAADNIVSGAYSYSGQRCTAVKRILAFDNIADTLIEKLKSRISQLKVGTPQEGATITPLIDEKAADFAEALIHDALDKGANLIIGNKREKNLIYPALLDNVTPEMNIAWEEPFAPILPIIRVSDIDMAIDIANRSEYGLQSSIFTSNINTAFYAADKLEVGTVQINNKTERGPDHFPFLGVKASGMGTQGIKYSIEAMTRPKAVIINLMH